MDKEVKKFSGHSGSEVFLMKNQQGLFVRKINNIHRNYERMTELLKLDYPVPKIYYHAENILDMEYIHGLDMKNYLRSHGIESIFNFLEKILSEFSTSAKEKDYSEIILKKIKNFDVKYDLPFTVEQLLKKMPLKLPTSVYHGDLTLENILKTEDDFFLIDCVQTEYDSYVFDIAKLRQDLNCKWFLRNDNLKLDVKLGDLENRIVTRFPISNNNGFIILMLFRVLEHCRKNDKDYNFLMKQIKKLWEEMK